MKTQTILGHCRVQYKPECTAATQATPRVFSVGNEWADDGAGTGSQSRWCTLRAIVHAPRPWRLKQGDEGRSARAGGRRRTGRGWAGRRRAAPPSSAQPERGAARPAGRSREERTGRPGGGERSDPAEWRNGSADLLHTLKLGLNEWTIARCLLNT
jgi:hypothetical protein